MVDIGDMGRPQIKALMIDDSNTIRRSAEIFLKQGDYDVFLCNDGFEALSRINDCEPDVIFCDVVMTKPDGYQTCSIIKRDEKFKDIPIHYAIEQGYYF